jgi:CubicO group peptidase (beta-lactamase class C family)
LTHTGGTGDVFGPEFTANRLMLREHADYVKLHGLRDLTHMPGAEFRYSNYGYVLLGAILEHVTGMSYYDVVRQQIFERARMTATDSLPETEVVPLRSVGYMRRNDAWVANTDWLPWRGTAAGGGYSTACDLLRFAHALEAGTLLSRKMLAEATRPHTEGYGYGFGTRDHGDVRRYGHSGGAPGMNAELRVFPVLAMSSSHSRILIRRLRRGPSNSSRYACRWHPRASDQGTAMNRRRRTLSVGFFLAAIPFPPVQSAGDGDEQEPEGRGLDHERDLTSQPQFWCEAASRPRRGTLPPSCS